MSAEYVPVRSTKLVVFASSSKSYNSVCQKYTFTVTLRFCVQSLMKDCGKRHGHDCCPAVGTATMASWADEHHPLETGDERTEAKTTDRNDPTTDIRRESRHRPSGGIHHRRDENRAAIGQGCSNTANQTPEPSPAFSQARGTRRNKQVCVMGGWLYQGSCWLSKYPPSFYPG